MAETTTTDPYPEHAKQAAVLDESQAIGRFLDEGPYVLAEFREVEGYRDPQLVPTSRSTSRRTASCRSSATSRATRKRTERATDDSARH